MLPPSIRIYVCTEPVDMRKAFDGLAAATREVMKKDPESDGLFLFVNKKNNRLKALWWDATGYALIYKRLEWGRFRLPQKLNEAGSSVEIDARELAAILVGVGVPSKRHRLYDRVMRERADRYCREH